MSLLDFYLEIPCVLCWSPIPSSNQTQPCLASEIWQDCYVQRSIAISLSFTYGNLALVLVNLSLGYRKTTSCLDTFKGYSVPLFSLASCVLCIIQSSCLAICTLFFSDTSVLNVGFLDSDLLQYATSWWESGEPQLISRAEILLSSEGDCTRLDNIHRTSGDLVRHLLCSLHWFKWIYSSCDLTCD